MSIPLGDPALRNSALGRALPRIDSPGLKTCVLLEVHISLSGLVHDELAFQRGSMRGRAGGRCWVRFRHEEIAVLHAGLAQVEAQNATFMNQIRLLVTLIMEIGYSPVWFEGPCKGGGNH